MQNIFLSIIMLFSLSAVACPDLNGTYKNADGEIHDIFMGKSKGITTFQWGDKAPAMLVDGKDHPSELDLSYNATCDNQKIKLLLKVGGNTVTTIITKTAQGYKYTSNDPQNPGDEYTKQP